MHKSGRTAPPAHLIAYQPAIRASLLKHDESRQHVIKKPDEILDGLFKQQITHRVQPRRLGRQLLSGPQSAVCKHPTARCHLFWFQAFRIAVDGDSVFA